MPQIIEYNREKAVEYAKRHAFVRDPSFFDFTEFGGNCTAFISQCLYNANFVMNPNPLGWYYYNSFNRSPSWSGVEFFYQFMTTNKTMGPFAHTCNVRELELGDIVQLKFYGYNHFTHTLLVTKITDEPSIRSEKNIYITTNTYDVLNRNLTSYHYKEARFLKISGVFV